MSDFLYAWGNLKRGMGIKSIQLLRILVQREITIRYKRSALGIGWTLLNPLFTSFILWIVFGHLFANQLVNHGRYAPYLVAGTLVINFFNQGVTLGADSILHNSSILTKIYVKPELFPLAVAISSFVHFLIGVIPLIIVCFISGQALAWTAPLILVVGFFLMLLVSGLGLVLSLLFVRFDDSRNITAIILTVLGYLTPVFYPIGILQHSLQVIVRLNPLTSYLNCFRWAFSNNAIATPFDWLYMASTGVASYVLGVYIFRKFWTQTVTML